MRQAIADLFATDDPREKFIRLSRLLNNWPDLHREVRGMRQETADGLYEQEGMTYGEIGDLIGITESRARHIVKGIVRPSREKAKATRTADDPEK